MANITEKTREILIDNMNEHLCLDESHLIGMRVRNHQPCCRFYQVEYYKKDGSRELYYD